MDKPPTLYMALHYGSLDLQPALDVGDRCVLPIGFTEYQTGNKPNRLKTQTRVCVIPNKLSNHTQGYIAVRHTAKSNPQIVESYEIAVKTGPNPTKCIKIPTEFVRRFSTLAIQSRRGVAIRPVDWVPPGHSAEPLAPTFTRGWVRPQNKHKRPRLV